MATQTGQLGLIQQDGVPVWSDALAMTLADSFLYQPATDQLYAWRFGNGLPRLLTLDTDARLQKLSTPGVHDLEFGLSSVDTITSVSNKVHPSLSATYRYDSVERLEAMTRTGDSQTFGWDLNGNRKAQTRDGEGAHTYTVSSTSNRLDGWSAAGKWRSFGYDTRGNLAAETRNDGSRNYVYDEFNRLSEAYVNGALVGRYSNNALNQRVQKNTAAGETVAIYGPNGELLAEVGASNTDYVWVGNQLFGIVRKGEFYASHNDQLGRPEALTNRDRAVAWRAENSAFDRKRVVTDLIGGLNVGFPGQYLDAETGQWYNWNRYYDAAVGRYTQSDPIGLAGGLNTYAYVGGNPLSGTDPKGLYSELPGGKDFGFSLTSPNNPVNQTWSGGVAAINKLMPDYISASLNLYVWSGGAALNLHNGRVYATGGLTRTYPAYSKKPGFCVMAGYISNGGTASAADKFLNGTGMQATIIGGTPWVGIGGGFSHAYGGSVSTEFGFGTPGAGVSPITYGK